MEWKFALTHNDNVYIQCQNRSPPMIYILIVAEMRDILVKEFHFFFGTVCRMVVNVCFDIGNCGSSII